MPNSWESNASGNIIVQASTERPVAGDEEHNRDTIPRPEKIASQKFFHPYGGSIFKEFSGRSAKISDLGTSL